MPIALLFLAGGTGSRMNSPLPKQYLPLRGIPLVSYSFDTFYTHPDIAEIIVVCEEQYRSYFPSATCFALPGQRRQDSVYNALQKISPHTTLVCIHDSARPFLSHADLNAVLSAAKIHGAASLGSPLHSSIKRVTPDHFIQESLDRTTLWQMHTPQVATPHLLRRGFEIAQEQNLTITDDNALVELTGHPVKLVPSTRYNLKVTTPEDLNLAEALCTLTK